MLLGLDMGIVGVFRSKVLSFTDLEGIKDYNTCRVYSFGRLLQWQGPVVLGFFGLKN